MKGKGLTDRGEGLLQWKGCVVNQTSTEAGCHVISGADKGAPAGGVLSVKKRRKLKKGTDPIKGGFIKAPKRGDAGEELTEMEIKAEAYGKKVARKQAKEAKKLEYKPKRNVRKKR